MPVKPAPDITEAAPRSLTITTLWSKLTRSALATLLVFPIITGLITGGAVYLVQRNAEQSDKQQEEAEKQRLKEEAAANPLIVAAALLQAVRSQPNPLKHPKLG